MLIAANFHYVRPTFEYPYDGIHGVTTDQFRAQLELLAGQAPFVSAADVRAAVRGDRPLPERCWLVTLDDGLKEQHEHAWPILRRLGIPAIFYVTTDAIENGRLTSVHKIHLLRATVAPQKVSEALDHHARRLSIDLGSVDAAKAARQYPYDRPEVARLKYLLNFALAFANRDRLVQACVEELLGWNEAAVAAGLYMSTSQVRDLAAAGCIGTHAHEHLPLGLLPEAEATRQIRTSIELIERWSGHRTYSLSYPYGSLEACSAPAAEAARKQGIEFAITMERAGNAGLDRPLFLARCACNDLPGGSAPRWALECIFQEVPSSAWHREPARP
jgi:peptidoglycan/xylan/chitin deacetylase (PgdA/CDA1 family)